jgi:hypothetical protein
MMPTEATSPVAARALLAAAYLWAGHLDRWEKELNELRDLSPQSDTDHLLMANALVLQAPLTALSYLKAKPRIEHSPAGVFIRGEAKVLMGIDQKDATRISEAVQDLRYAQFFCQNSQSVKSWHVKALAAAIELARLQGRPDDVPRFVTEGQRLADELGTGVDYAWGDYCRWIFYTASGDENQAWSTVSRLGRRSGDNPLILASHCLQRHDTAAAADQFNQTIAVGCAENDYLRLARAHLVVGGQGEAHRVRELVADLVNSASPLTRRHALSALCLVSNPDEIRNHARTANASISANAYRPGDLFNGTACLRFLAGQETEEELLNDAGEHGYAQANAHFTIAMMRLAAGNRDGAHEHFRKCADTHTIGSIDHELGRAYLARMDADSTWPSWIQDKVDK